MEKTREIKNDETGKCPFCDSIDYERQIQSFDGDAIVMECECHKCNKDFTELFLLVLQEWEDED